MRNSFAIAAFFVSLAVFCALPARAGFLDVSDAKEAEMGQEVAEAYINTFGLVKDKDLDSLVDRLGQKLAAVSDRKGVDYHFYVLDDRTVNAFALPGGYIFVTKGLLDFTDNEDEVAGVIAHEIVHVANRHGITSYKKGMRAMFYNMLLLALTQNPGLLTASTMVNETRMTTYGRRAELESDHYGMDYMIRAGIDPVAFLRFLDRMKRLEARQPFLLENYYEVHPPADERIELAENHLKQKGVNIKKNRKIVTSTRVQAWESCRDGKCEGLLKGRDIDIIRFPSAGRTDSSLERAKEAAEKINEALLDDLKPYQIQLREEGSRASIWVRNEKIIDVYPEDAKAADSSVGELASKWREQLQYFLWADSVRGS